MRTGKSINSSLGERLDKLSLPAGSSFNKEAAWEKLHGRLQKRKTMKKRVAFIAGISIPVAASLFFLLFGNKTQEKESTKPPVTESRIVQVPSKKTSTENKSIIVIPKKSISSHKTRDKKNRDQNKQEETKETAAIIPVIQPPIDTTVVQNPAVAPAVVKKKLKVVHNNELGGSSTSPPEVQRPLIAAIKPGLFPGFRRKSADDPEAISEDTLTKQRTKRSILPFSSLISQKE